MLRQLKPLLVVGLLFLTVLVAAAGVRAGQPEPTPPPVDGGVQQPGQAQAPNACAAPQTQNIRGKDATLDLCYQRNFSHNGTNYEIQTYYTETNSTTNTNRCNATENANGVCEHALANNDDSNGNNINAVAMAAEAERAMRFYADRNLTFLPGGGTTLIIYLAEDPRLGGTPTTTSINIDDEAIDNNDTLNKRWLAFHEIQHLVQSNYDTAPGWRAFYGEGIARAIEDRVDTQLDADTGHMFIPEVRGILSNDGERSSDLSSLSYRSVLWWTWLMDQYRAMGETEPVLGWQALRDFYIELDTESDQVKAIRDFIGSRGSSFRSDFIDYTLALFAHRFNPSNARLSFLDAEIRNNGGGLSGHTVITGGPAFSTSTVAMNPRSSRYWEFNPANQCQFTAFTFDGNGRDYGFSLLTVDGGALQNRWTSFSKTWARTVRSADLDRVVGVISAVDDSGNVTLGRGCVNPTVNIKNPTTSMVEMVGKANSPRKFIVRVKVTGSGGGSVAGLLASDFTVQLRKAGGGHLLNATIINSAYVQDDYWLLVRPPNAAAGAQNGEFYDLIVNLGPQNDTESSAVLYVQRTQDVVVVLDRSGSMTTANKIQAARNAADLLVNELGLNDQGAFVAFDTDATLRVPLAPVGSGTQRSDLVNAIAAEVPLNWTSIGDGLWTAAAEEDARGVSSNQCSFVLLSDGYENEPAMWADVRPEVTDNGCAIHAISLGPEANETLMQQIAASVPGGSHDYADSSSNVPILSNVATQQATAAGTLGWENNLSRIYDHKASAIAGRQQIPLAVGQQVDDERESRYKFYVDETSTELVTAVAWQKPSDSYELELIDPDGNPVAPTEVVRSEFYTNEVLRVADPLPGYWELIVRGLYQEHYVSATAETQFEMYLFIGAPVESLNQGSKVPLLATFVGPEKPVIGASVTATVLAPDGLVSVIALYDDGNHGDGEADDGVYGGVYTATAESDGPLPDKVIEGEEPQYNGSYQVKVIGILDDLQREATGSFTIAFCADENGNDLPDCWEKENEVERPDDDPDGDKLNNYCEFRLGTDPHNSDTDGGGETDGSEVPECRRPPNGQDPLNPADDRVGPFSSVLARPELFDLKAIILVKWGPLLRGELRWVDVYRRAVAEDGTPREDWQLIAEDVEGDAYEDRAVEPGVGYQYRLIPHGQAGDMTFEAAVGETTPVTASADPHPPGGSILINNGDSTTGSLLVTLTLAADDLSESHDGGPAEPIPGTPTEKLEMRIGNRPDFEGATWQPFAATVTGWDLGDVKPGETATVYVQFRDEAGNVSESGLGSSDTILYQTSEGGSQLYLPTILR